jgi:hypothetical protein
LNGFRVSGLTLHLEETPLVEKSPDHLDYAPTHDKRLSVIGMHDKVEVPLSIPAEKEIFRV